MSAPYAWSGMIRKAGDGIEGLLTDPFGYTIRIAGARTEGGYALTGTPGPIPESLSLPGDEELFGPVVTKG